jgi:GDSL-like Lipase/Acylhydrolase family
MNARTLFLVLFLLGGFCLSSARGQEKPLPQDGDYAAAMKKVAAKFRGKPGVVLHVGDSITYSNPYGQWARGGAGKTDADKAILKWMHAGADNDTDGWYLARFDHPAGGRSQTACSGIRAEEMLAGGKQQMPPLSKIVEAYQPQMVILMLGTNDASANRTVDAFRKDMTKAVDVILERGAICILSTIPPHPNKPELAKSYNEALREIAKERSVPLIDFEKETLARRPNDWNGTLLGKNDVHPTGGKPDGVNAASAPTAENLRSCGYLLRGWLSVQKVAEVKKKVLDGLPEPKGEK